MEKGICHLLDDDPGRASILVHKMTKAIGKGFKNDRH